MLYNSGLCFHTPDPVSSLLHVGFRSSEMANILDQAGYRFRYSHTQPRTMAKDIAQCEINSWYFTGISFITATKHCEVGAYPQGYITYMYVTPALLEKRLWNNVYESQTFCVCFTRIFIREFIPLSPQWQQISHTMQWVALFLQPQIHATEFVTLFHSCSEVLYEIHVVLKPHSFPFVSINLSVPLEDAVGPDTANETLDWGGVWTPAILSFWKCSNCGNCARRAWTKMLGTRFVLTVATRHIYPVYLVLKVYLSQ